MKVANFIMIISILIIFLLCGCIGRTREALSPDLSLQIMDHWIENSDPDGNTPMKDHVWLYVEMNISNRNENIDHDLKFNRFFLGSTDGKEHWCMGILKNDTLIKNGASKDITLFFELPEGADPDWIEYSNTMGEEYRSYF